jgi:hypothetical protein
VTPSAAYTLIVACCFKSLVYLAHVPLNFEAGVKTLLAEKIASFIIMRLMEKDKDPLGAVCGHISHHR